MDIMAADIWCGMSDTTLDASCLHPILECSVPNSCFLLIGTPGRQHAVAQVGGSLLPMWETSTEFLAAGFGLAQFWEVQAFGE